MLSDDTPQLEKTSCCEDKVVRSAKSYTSCFVKIPE